MSIRVVPGVYFDEIDRSTYLRQVSTAINLVIGEFEKGPRDKHVSITSLPQLRSTFGNCPRDVRKALAYYAIEEYLKQGNRVWVYNISHRHPTTHEIDAKRAVAEINVAEHQVGASNAILLQDVDESMAEISLQLPYFPVVKDDSNLSIQVVADADGTPTETFTDDGDGTLSGDSSGTGTIDYETGEVTLTPGSAITSSEKVIGTWTRRALRLRFQAGSEGPWANGDSVRLIRRKTGLNYNESTQKQEKTFDYFCEWYASGSTNPVQAPVSGFHLDNRQDAENPTLFLGNMIQNVTDRLGIAEIIPVTGEDLGTVSATSIDLQLAQGNIEPGTLKIFGAAEYEDDGSGSFKSANNLDIANCSINYTTGEVTLAFNSAPISEALSAAYSYEFSGTRDLSSLFSDFDEVDSDGNIEYAVDGGSDLNESVFAGTFGSGQNAVTGTMGTDVNYDDLADPAYGVRNAMDPNQTDANLVIAPGFYNTRATNQIDSPYSAANLLLQEAGSHEQIFAIVDPPNPWTSAQKFIDWHNGVYRANASSLNSSWGATYGPFLSYKAHHHGKLIPLPPSVVMAATYAYNDRVGYPWRAPAGYIRGIVRNVQGLWGDWTPTQGDIALMQTGSNAVNALIDDPTDGVVALGQRTLQRHPSDTDRVHARRLLIYARKVISTGAKYFMFQPNDFILWERWKGAVRPVFANIQRKRGVYRFKVVSDASTNTEFDVQNHTTVGQIQMQIIKNAEIITNQFVLYPYGAEFGAVQVQNAA